MKIRRYFSERAIDLIAMAVLGVLVVTLLVDILLLELVFITASAIVIAGYSIFMPYTDYIIKRYSHLSYHAKKKHVAIIIPYYSNFKRISYIFIRFERFFADLKSNDIPFVTYVIHEPSEFNKIMKNNISTLLIFGHGMRHGVRIGNRTHYFCDTIKKKIDYVVQLHCNSKGGKPLNYYLECEEGYVTEKNRNSIEVNKILKDQKFIQRLKELT